MNLHAKADRSCQGACTWSAYGFLARASKKGRGSLSPRPCSSAMSVAKPSPQLVPSACWPPPCNENNSALAICRALLLQVNTVPLGRPCSSTRLAAKLFQMLPVASWLPLCCACMSPLDTKTHEAYQLRLEMPISEAAALGYGSVSRCTAHSAADCLRYKVAVESRGANSISAKPPWLRRRLYCRGWPRPATAGAAQVHRWPAGNGHGQNSSLTQSARPSQPFTVQCHEKARKAAPLAWSACCALAAGTGP